MGVFFFVLVLVSYTSLSRVVTIPPVVELLCYASSSFYFPVCASGVAEAGAGRTRDNGISLLTAD